MLEIGIISSIVGAISGAVLYRVAARFLSGYLPEKGKNLATKEDVGRITDIVEEVKREHAEQMREVSHRFDLMLEEKKSSNQLRVAALDRRLDAHQQAFALWRKLFNSIHGPDITDVVIECQNWWDNNCLYLEPAAREAFANAYAAADLHRAILENSRRDCVAIEEININWKIITDAAEIITSSVALPGLTSAETAAITAKRPS